MKNHKNFQKKALEIQIIYQQKLFVNVVAKKKI